MRNANGKASTTKFFPTIFIRYLYPRNAKAIMTKVNPSPNEYSAKATKSFTFSISTLFCLISKFALEFDETELTNKINAIINKKVAVTIPLLGGFGQINAKIVRTIPIIVVESIIQSFTLIFSSFELILLILD
ncbi:MAG: hypothetical protein GF329_04995 [Candidatus Lokiarchaeota archaeon]|nr:hypothetical protein [Candidatus Lokiarchaeota archaeon]